MIIYIAVSGSAFGEVYIERDAIYRNYRDGRKVAAGIVIGERVAVNKHFDGTIEEGKLSGNLLVLDSGASYELTTNNS